MKVQLYSNKNLTGLKQDALNIVVRYREADVVERGSV